VRPQHAPVKLELQASTSLSRQRGRAVAIRANMLPNGQRPERHLACKRACSSSRAWHAGQPYQSPCTQLSISMDCRSTRIPMEVDTRYDYD